MSKAIIVVDFAYKSPKRSGRGTGHKGLRSTLKYLQYRDNRSDHQAQSEEERWHDLGMGQHYREIFENCDQLQSPHVLAWTWVVSPAPDLMALFPAAQRPQVVCDLTERIVEDYYAERGFDLPEYSYVLHDRLTEPKEDGDSPMQQLHTHVVLPGTAPSVAERLPVYNNKERGHDALFRNASGTATQEGSADDKYSRSRPLLTVDEVITPQIGNCTIFARYVEAGFATQVVLNARLTRFYERDDWKRRLQSGADVEPLLLERGIRLELSPLQPRDKLREAAQSVMDKAGTVQFTGLASMRRSYEAGKNSVEVS